MYPALCHRPLAHTGVGWADPMKKENCEGHPFSLVLCVNSLHGSSRVDRGVVGKSLSQEDMFRAIYPGSTPRRVHASEVCL